MFNFVLGQGGGPSGPQITGNDPSLLPNILPSSPEAYKLGSYGNIPLNLFTGTTNINIPLTEFKTSTLTLPITLHYASNGIKIDDMNGSTGLGWNLITGGVITRNIRDMPDEDNANIIFPSNIDSLGIRHPIVMQYLQDASNDLVDSEQDMYLASFNGNSIRFVFDRRGMPVVYSQQDIIIEGRSGGDSFIITMGDGIKYYFTDREITTNRTVGDGHSIPSINTTAWYLTKIKDSSSGEEIIIENQDAYYSTLLSNSQSMKYTESVQHSVCGGSSFYLPPSIGILINHLQSVNGKQIKRVYSNNPNFGDIIFDYESYIGNEDYKKLNRIVKKVNAKILNDIDFTYILTTNKRLFLSEINDTVFNKVHSFNYNIPDELPLRLSFARDTGGYYNAVLNNNNLIPQIPNTSIIYNGADQQIFPIKSQAGMLKKITYPTKGNSEFFYENHTQIKSKMILPGQSGGLSLGAQSTDIDLGSPSQTKSETFTSIKNEEVILGGSASFNSTKCDPNLQVSGKHKARVTLSKSTCELIPFYTKTVTGTTTLIGNAFVLPTNGNTFYAKIPKDELLKLTITTSFECTRSSVSISYTIAEPVYGNAEVEVPGLRINKIINNADGHGITVKKFVYKDLNDQFSHATINKQPVFEEGLNKTRTCLATPLPGSTTSSIPYGLERFSYNAITSSNINEFNASHPNIFYKTVQEIIEGNSNIIHNFSIDTDYFGKLLHGADIRVAPWTNFGWNNGREILTKYLDSNNKLIRTVENIYEEDNSKKYTIDGFAIRKNYENPISMNVVQKCKFEQITATYQQTVCTTNHNHFRKSFDGYKNCFTPGANNITQIYKHPCYGKNIGEIIIYDDQLDNLDIVQYKNISYFDYLKNQKSTDYLNGVPLKTETEYFYDNPLHYQITKTVTTTEPDLNIVENKFQYAHEKGNTKLINANIVGIPLETTVLKKQNSTDVGKVISRQETKYDDPTNLFPSSVLSQNLQTNVMSTELTYDQYDGNW